MNCPGIRVVALATVTGLMPARVFAAAPDRVPIQGYVTDAFDAPVDGIHTVRLRLYATAVAGAALHDESLAVSFENGYFETEIGSTATLDLTLFRDMGTLFLGVTIDLDPEMAPRVSLGSSPFAAFAEYAGDAATVGGLPPTDLANPSGAVMFFDLSACPAGWSPFAALEGRVPLGVPAGGTPGGQVGVPLADMSQRLITGTTSHTHPVNQTAAGGHGHIVDPAGFDSGFQDATHSHSGTTTSDTHDHDIRIELGGAYGTYAALGSPNTGLGDISNVPILNDTHSHTFNTGSNSASHRHNVDVPSTSTAGDPADHDHAVSTAPPAAAGPVDVSMPYTQLIACRKD